MSAAYTVNMATAPTSWTPEVWQMRAFLNPNYFNSLWLGTVWNVVLLPTRLWHECISLLLSGRAIAAVLHAFVLVFSMIAFLGWGIAGRLRGHRLPLDTVIRSEFLDERDGYGMVKLGSPEHLHKN